MFARVWLIALVACSYTPPEGTTDGGSGSDVTPPADDLHVLITEVALFGGNTAVEFIELYNPRSEPVALANYYLTDEREYWKLPAHAVDPKTIVLDDSDFLVRFPAGATIPAGGVIVIATDGVDYVDTTTMEPTFTIRIASAAAPLLEAIVPTGGNMDERLTNGGEMVALFEWDGMSDRVHDVDLVVTGAAPTSGNTPVAKAPIDGPDRDATVTPYNLDALSIGVMVRDSVSGESYKRIAREGTHEQNADGNGITGHDETSEQQTMTWDTGSLGITPGVIPPSLL